MNDFNATHRPFIPTSYLIAAVVFSGLGWYLSFDLSGKFWYLLWLAPVPILMISFYSNWKRSFLIAFIAYLIGRLSWFTYLATVMTIVPAIIATLLLALIFGLIVLLSRRIVIKTNSCLSVFAFPVFFTCFEFLVVQFSADGSAGSIAYSQSNFLALIQIVSVTGLFGITFFITLVPSAIAVGWFYYNQEIKISYLVTVSGIIIGVVLIFGALRLSFSTNGNTIKAGAVSLEEKYHDISRHPDFENAKVVADDYADEITKLAAQGARLVVIPERALNINKKVNQDIIDTFSYIATQYHTFIVAGYTNYKDSTPKNSCLVIDAAGDVTVDYNKVHLVKGFEDWFTPGKEPGLFKLGEIQAGTAICKDLDFPRYIRKYGNDGAAIVCVPAWDFIKDDWLHSRMAILRDIENGFSEIRAARQGRLTISDAYGRVSDEAITANGQKATIMGEVPIDRKNTLFTRLGNWFGILVLAAAIILLLLPIKFHNK